MAAAAPAGPDFAAALTRSAVAVIAEVKRQSPSKGTINAAIDAGAQAAAYESGGAAAISVLTEPRHFGGSSSDLSQVRERVRIPVLKKDFHIDPIQLLEARALGASAALLIARALDPVLLAEMIGECARLGITSLVEVRSESELERALSGGATVVGVNSRDLESLVVDARVPERIVPLIPASIPAVWESGVQAAADVERAASFGADAVLVGSALSASADPVGAVEALAATPRRGRA
jgi:indole-3-glycerol phosphate synthase